MGVIAPGSDLTRRLTEGVVASACVAFIAVYVVVAVLRLGHAYELQWMEGGSVDHVRRLLDGRALYPQPSVDFASFAYPPLYYWVSAPVAWITGVGFLPLRLVSFAASLATMGVLAATARRMSGQWLPALVAAGLFAASFRATGAWYDVARVDSLFVLLLVSSVAVIGAAETWRGAAAAGALLALASLTKQTALLAAAPLLAYLVVRRPLLGVPYLAAFLLPWSIVTLVLQLTSHGWYWYSTVEMLAGHPVERSAWIGFPLRDIAAHLAPALAVIAVVAWKHRPPWALHLVAVAGMVGAAWVSRLHAGGYTDVLIPAFAGVALLGGLAVGYLRDVRGRVRVLVGAGVALQVAVLAYSPGAQIPDTTDVGAGRALVTAIRAVPGDVLVVSHPWYAVMAGKRSHAQAAAIADVMRSGDREAKRLLSDSIARGIREQRFGAVVFDTGVDEAGFPADFERWYRQIEPPVLGPGQPGLRPVTDLAVRPTTWWVPREAAPPDSATSTGDPLRPPTPPEGWRSGGRPAN